MCDPRRHRRQVRPVVLALALLLTGGCSAAPVDRAGGAAARDVRVVTFGQFGVTPGPALEAWAGQVKTLSGGSLRVEFKNEWRADRIDYETATVDDVRAGTVDVAMVGARVFDRVGVTSFHALLAPMLVDSQALQGKVFAAGIPDEMAQDLEPAGVVALGTLPGPLRKLLGLSKPFLRPKDFAGTVVGTQDSDLASRTLKALGATPKFLGPGASLDGVDGYEQQLGSIAGNHYVDVAKFVTTNLDLWPRPQVIITSPSLIDSVSPQQRRALQQAVLTARPVAARQVTDEDDSSAPTLCADGMTLTVASPDDLRELAAALVPVLADLRTEPRTRSWLERIRALKADLGAGPDTQTCQVQAADTVASPIPNGAYDRLDVRGEALPGCPPNTDHTGTWVFRLVFHDGRLHVYERPDAPGTKWELGWTGAFNVFHDRLTITETGTGDSASFAWTLSGRRLTLSDTQPFGCGGASVWTLRPWDRVT